MSNVERRLSEAELNRARREAMELAEVGMARYTYEGTVQYVDRTALRILDLDRLYPDPAAAVGSQLSDLLVFLQSPGELFDRIRREGRVRGYEYPLRTLSGIEKWVQVDCYIIPAPRPSDVSVQILFRDITEQKRASEALLKSEQKYRMIAESMSDIVWTLDMDLHVTYMNHSVERVLGYTAEEAMALGMNNLLSSESYAEVRRLIAKRLATDNERRATEYPPVIVDAEHRRKDGGTVRCEITARFLRDESLQPVGIIGVARDVSERRRLEEQIRQAQKLESLGVLAGGIAHDFNNLLTGVLANAQFVLEDSEPGSPMHETVSDIISSARRAAGLCRQMLAYSGKGRFSVDKTDFSALVKALTPLLYASTSKKARLELELATALPLVEVDADQLRQVVVNLVTNASEALGEETGTITIRSGVGSFEPDYFRDGPMAENLPAGEYAFIEVADTGCGMDAETLSRIFDPFFSTKFMGRGLGMSAVLGIIRGHSGAIRIDTSPGQGTTVRALFPIPQIESPIDIVNESPDQPWKPSGVILVVDDEDPVRKVTRRVLIQCGFSVLLAEDGRQAIEMFQKREADIAAVLLDLTMPVMAGDEVYRELRKLSPNLPILLSSGYAPESFTGRLPEDFDQFFIQKPYEKTQLMDRLRAVMERK